MKEKRNSKRRQILENFSFFVCVPKIGAAKLAVHDISETGIGFSIDTLGEFRLDQKAESNLQFYLNQTLFLPLKIQVMRQYEENGVQQIGAVFLETQSPAHQTFLSLVKLVDQLESHGEWMTSAG